MRYVTGDNVIARVTRDYPRGYAWGADDPTAVSMPAQIVEIGGPYGVDWCCVRLTADRDTAEFPAEYAHIPIDRLTPAEEAD